MFVLSLEIQVLDDCTDESVETTAKHIKEIQKMNKWTDNQVGGFEVLLNNFDEIELKGEEVGLFSLPYFRSHELFNLAKQLEINIDENITNK